MHNRFLHRLIRGYFLELISYFVNRRFLRYLLSYLKEQAWNLGQACNLIYVTI